MPFSVCTASPTAWHFASDSCTRRSSDLRREARSVPKAKDSSAGASLPKPRAWRKAWRASRDFSRRASVNAAASIPPRGGDWRFRTARRLGGRAKSGDQRLESKFERRVPFRFLEEARNAREPRALRDDVSVVDRLGGRRVARVAGCLFQRRTGQKISHRAKLPRHRLGIRHHSLNERKHLLQESHADRRVEPMERDQRI